MKWCWSQVIQTSNNQTWSCMKRLETNFRTSYWIPSKRPSDIVRYCCFSYLGIAMTEAGLIWHAMLMALPIWYGLDPLPHFRPFSASGMDRRTGLEDWTDCAWPIQMTLPGKPGRSTSCEALGALGTNLILPCFSWLKGRWYKRLWA